MDEFQELYLKSIDFLRVTLTINALQLLFPVKPSAEFYGRLLFASTYMFTINFGARLAYRIVKNE